MYMAGVSFGTLAAQHDLVSMQATAQIHRIVKRRTDLDAAIVHRCKLD